METTKMHLADLLSNPGESKLFRSKSFDEPAYSETGETAATIQEVILNLHVYQF